MALPDQVANAASVQGSELAYQDGGIDGVDAMQAQVRYDKERAKRVRDDGSKQYIEPSQTDKFRHFQNDPWVDSATVKNIDDMFPTKRCRFLICGAGLGGLIYAIRLVQAGFDPKDIRIIDTAGGVGGTWYWNRYPGLMCDIESYCYLPLLEEMDYMPRHRYAYGEEIREYANLLAKRWNILDSTVLQTKCQHLEWNETENEWAVDLQQQREGQQPHVIGVHSQFVLLVNGPLNWPKLPDLPGLLDYKGVIFHTSRWNYDLTGGSPVNPELVKLKDKRVAIIGTGATAVQIVPELAQWAKHLYVVQRTPSAIDERGQKETDPVWYRKEVANKPGWQRERIKNFHAHFTTGKQPEINLVNDQWTHANTMVGVAGNADGPQTFEQIPGYAKKLHDVDLSRQNRIRQRAKDVVKDPKTAESLQAWYPTWCKRPCFHDEYLSTFNRENTTLIDTDGKGLDGLTEDSILVNGEQYAVDIVIFATGFRAPFIGTPADKANMKIVGRGGISMSNAWAQNGPTTLHGVIDQNFPNLLLSGLWQASLSGNNTFSTDVLAQHVAYILREAERKAQGNNRYVVSATKEGVEDWGTQILMHSAPMAVISGCTPGYFNVEGELDRVPPEAQMQLARSGLWGWGIEDFVIRLEEWRTTGDMKGIEVRV